MTHEHEPQVELGGIIKCRTCGAILPYAEQELGRFSSSRMVNRILDEIAIKGEFQADSFEEGFIVYSKEKDGIREELTARKLLSRVYVIIKRMITKEVRM